MAAIREITSGPAARMDEMASSYYTSSEEEVAGRIFPTCEKISVFILQMKDSSTRIE